MKNILLILLCITLVGCSQTNEITPNQEQPTSQILEKNTSTKTDILPKTELNLSMRIPTTLNPILNEDFTVDSILKLVFEPLFTVDENLKVVPNLAESYSFDQSKNILTINIKNNLTWQNGSKITADDVVFTLASIRNAPNSIYYNAIRGMRNFYVVKKTNSLNIEYDNFNYSYLQNLCFPVIAKEYYTKNMTISSEKSFLPMGSGSYKFSSYKVVRELILEKSTSFKGTPTIEKINVIIVPDKISEDNSFEQKITDIISVDISKWGKFDSTKKLNVYNYNSNNFEFLGFNLTNPILQNINIRKAISLIIPFDEILENIYLSKGVKSISPVNPKSWIFDENTENFDYNTKVEEALEYVIKSGLSKEQLSFKILINAQNNERKETAKIISNRLNQIGITTEIEIKSFEDYQTSLNTGNYHLFIGGINFSYVIDYVNLLRTDGSLNYFNYTNEGMDNIINNLSNSVTEEQYRENLNRLDHYFKNNLPFIGLLFKDKLILTYNEVTISDNLSLYNIYNDITNWKFSS